MPPLREVRLALLEVMSPLPVKELYHPIREMAVGATVLKSVRPDQQVIKIVYDGLVQMLGGEASPLKLDVTPPAVILMAGLVWSQPPLRASWHCICKKSIRKKLCWPVWI